MQVRVVQQQPLHVVVVDELQQRPISSHLVPVQAQPVDVQRSDVGGQVVDVVRPVPHLPLL